MTPEELFEALCGLADEVALEVRTVSAIAADGSPVVSGVCRLRERVWVLLSAADPLEQRIDVLAEGLRRQGGDRFEARFLPPAVRDRLDPP